MSHEMPPSDGTPVRSIPRKDAEEVGEDAWRQMAEEIRFAAASEKMQFCSLSPRLLHKSLCGSKHHQNENSNEHESTTRT